MFDERFDAKIDEVAREMTRGELPPDFRAHVIARLETRHDRTWVWRPAWVLAPLTVVGIVLLAVFVARAPSPFVAQDSSPALPERIAPAEQTAVVRLKPDTTYALKPDTTYALKPDTTYARKPEATYERDAGRSGLASDLAPAPIRIESIDGEAMESIEVAPLTVDAMESIEVPRLSVAPLEVQAIGE